MTKAPNEILETAARLLSVPESSADGLRALANFAAQQRNASMMFDSLRALWRRGDATMKDQLALARAYFLLGDLHRALILLNRLSREADVDAELLTLRAMTAVFAGRPAMALREAAAASEALDSTDANGMERRAADWLVNYLAGFLERPGRSRPYGRAALIHRWRGLKPPIETPVIALLDYRSPDLHGASRNLGDWIQTVAALRHVARLGGLEWTYDDPDMAVVLQRTAATWIDEERIAINGKAHLAVLDRDFPWPAAHRFPERPVWAIYNGWFCHSAFGRMAAMPAPENLQPLLVSFHLARAEDLTGAVVEWLRKFEPVGCRDWSTVYWLANQGVQCFFSGCLTLTLASATAIGGEGERLAVDVEPEQGERAIGQTANGLDRLSLAGALSLSLDRLDLFRSAIGIRTSRLHCALPAWALGAPVEFVNPKPADRRFEGLIDANDARRRLMRDELTALLAMVLPAIAAGETVETVRALWRDATAPAVARTRASLENYGIGGSGPRAERAAKTSAEVEPPKQKQSRVALAIAFDAAYQEYARVLLRSIRAHTAVAIDLVLLVRGVEAQEAEAVGRVVEPATIRVLDMEGWLEGARIALLNQISISTMDRLRLPDLLPDVDRLLYLDCDTLVLDDIAELAAFDPGPTGIAARPARNMHVTNLAQALERRCRSLDETTARNLRRVSAAVTDLAAPYFNAGVLVLSLETLRRTGFCKRAVSLVQRFGLDDQDALNMLAGGVYTALPERWNAMPRVDFCERPSIIHWVGGAKPWGGRPVRFADRWRQFRELDQGEAITPEHWLDASSYPPEWGARAQAAARYARPDDAVLDIGCGARLSLEAHLPATARYSPADMRAWTDAVQVVDLERDEFPTGDYDVVFLLGVLEYLSRPLVALRKARRSAGRLVFSYCHPVGRFSADQRRRKGWVNTLREAPLKKMLGRIGWSVREEVEFDSGPQVREVIYHCEVADPVRADADSAVRLPGGASSTSLQQRAFQGSGLSALAQSVRAERLTYLRPAKMARLEAAAAEIASTMVPGDYVEFGVALGGSAIVLAHAARADGRKFLGLDVFGMIPAPNSDHDDQRSQERFEDIATGRSTGIGGDVYYGYRQDLYAEVVGAFSRHGLEVDGGAIRLDKGLFEEMWPSHAGRTIALAHIDCDWFEPVSFCLSTMERQLSPGGIIIVDDYHDWSGAKVAVDAFLDRRNDFTVEDGANLILRRFNHATRGPA